MSITAEQNSEFAEIVRDLAIVLGERPEPLVRRFQGEERPEELQFAYSPPEGLAPGADTPSGGDAPEAGGAADAQPTGGRALAANAACTLCDDRTFPLRGFRRQGKLPVLVLHYSGPLRPGDSLRDRSRELLFQSPEEDELFGRLLGALDLTTEHLHFLQYPACVFNPERSLPEDWNRRCANCLFHVNEYVRENGIRLLLLLGNSAVFLLSEEKARELAKTGSALPLPLEAGEVPALVLRSPGALLALERKRQTQGAKDREGDEYKRLLDEEKRIKRSVLDSLRRAKEQFLG